MCTGKKKQNKDDKEDKEQEKISFTRVHTIGDCELRSLLMKDMCCDHNFPAYKYYVFLADHRSV